MQPIELMQKIEQLAEKAKRNADHYGKKPFTTDNGDYLYWCKFWRLKELRYLKILINQSKKPVGQTALGRRIIERTADRIKYLMFLVGNADEKKRRRPEWEQVKPKYIGY